MQAMPKAPCGRNKTTNLNQDKRITKRFSVSKTPSQKKKFSEDNGFGYIQHFKDTKHQFNKRKRVEGMYIQKNLDQLVNLKAGTSIDKCWLPLLTTMKRFEI